MTDMALGRTIHFALKNKAAVWVVASLETALKLHPMGLKGIHSDNGSEFLNHPVFDWCKAHGVAFTKSRSIRKNDKGIYAEAFMPLLRGTKKLRHRP
jgi:transposase InsO family protein